MSRAAKRTKGQIKDAAISLFAVRGFGSTSIREISEAAGVNSALISYHFKNKQGILESIMVDYFEGLNEELNQRELEQPYQDSYSQLIDAADTIIAFQCRDVSVSAIILRELSMDSMLVREIMSTYIARLKAHFFLLLEKGIHCGEFRPDLDLELQVIHMMGSIFFPYFNPQLIREVFYEEPTSQEYRRKYVNYLSKIWGYELKI